MTNVKEKNTGTANKVKYQQRQPFCFFRLRNYIFTNPKKSQYQVQAVCRIVSPNVKVKLFLISASNRLPAYFFGRPVFLAFKNESCYKGKSGKDERRGK